MDLADKKDPSVREDLRIMDALSLLLVTGDESDAASAAFFRGPDRRLTVIFAKNRACTEDELLYIRQLKCSRWTHQNLGFERMAPPLLPHPKNSDCTRAEHFLSCSSGPLVVEIGGFDGP
jgi:hypothetical protein